MDVKLLNNIPNKAFDKKTNVDQVQTFSKDLQLVYPSSSYFVNLLVQYVHPDNLVRMISALSPESQNQPPAEIQSTDAPVTPQAPAITQMQQQDSGENSPPANTIAQVLSGGHTINSIAVQMPDLMSGNIALQRFAEISRLAPLGLIEDMPGLYPIGIILFPFRDVSFVEQIKDIPFDVPEELPPVTPIAPPVTVNNPPLPIDDFFNLAKTPLFTDGSSHFVLSVFVNYSDILINDADPDGDPIQLLSINGFAIPSGLDSLMFMTSLGAEVTLYSNGFQYDSVITDVNTNFILDEEDFGGANLINDILNYLVTDPFGLTGEAFIRFNIPPTPIADFLQTTSEGIINSDTDTIQWNWTIDFTLTQLINGTFSNPEFSGRADFDVNLIANPAALDVLSIVSFSYFDASFNFQTIQIDSLTIGDTLTLLAGRTITFLGGMSFQYSGSLITSSSETSISEGNIIFYTLADGLGGFDTTTVFFSVDGSILITTPPIDGNENFTDDEGELGCIEESVQHTMLGSLLDNASDLDLGNNPSQAEIQAELDVVAIQNAHFVDENGASLGTTLEGSELGGLNGLDHLKILFDPLFPNNSVILIQAFADGAETTLVAEAKITIDPDTGVPTYDNPGDLWQSLGIGESIFIAFNYKVEDSTGLQSQGFSTTTIEFCGENDCPELIGRPVIDSITEDAENPIPETDADTPSSEVNDTAAPEVSGNLINGIFMDPDGDTLSIIRFSYDDVNGVPVNVDMVSFPLGVDILIQHISDDDFEGILTLGFLHINPDGSYSFELNHVEAEKLDEGEEVNFTFTYIVNDASGEEHCEVESTYTLNILGVNDCPAVVTDQLFLAVSEDESQTIPGNLFTESGTQIPDPDYDDVDVIKLVAQVFNEDTMTWDSLGFTSISGAASAFWTPAFNNTGRGATQDIINNLSQYAFFHINVETGNYTFDLDQESPDIQTLNAGETIQLRYVMTISEGHPECDEEITINVTITGVEKCDGFELEMPLGDVIDLLNPLFGHSDIYGNFIEGYGRDAIFTVHACCNIDATIEKGDENNVIYALSHNNYVNAGAGDNYVFATGCCWVELQTQFIRDELGPDVTQEQISAIIQDSFLNFVAFTTNDVELPYVNIFRQLECCDAENQIFSGTGRDVLIGIGSHNFIVSDLINPSQGVNLNAIQWQGELPVDVVIAESEDNLVILGGGANSAFLVGCCEVADNYGEAFNEYMQRAVLGTLYTGGQGSMTPFQLLAQTAIDVGCCDTGINQYFAGGFQNDVVSIGKGNYIVIGTMGNEVDYEAGGNNHVLSISSSFNYIEVSGEVGEENVVIALICCDEQHEESENQEIAMNDLPGFGGLSGEVVLQLIQESCCDSGQNNITTGLSNDTILASGATNIINSDFNNDYVVPTNMGGNDDIWAFGLNNTINAGGGQNRIVALGCCEDQSIDFLTDVMHYFSLDFAITRAQSPAGNLVFDISFAGLDAMCPATKNTITTGDQNDDVFSIAEESTITTSDGSDWVRLLYLDDENAGTSLVNTGADHDTIVSNGLGNDTIFAGSGEDAIFAGAGNDDIHGEGDKDFILGEDGNDTISGGGGGDNIYGGNGDDAINGDGGDDFIDGQAGADKIDAGADDDTVVFDANDASKGVDGNTGCDTLFVLDDADSNDDINFSTLFTAFPGSFDNFELLNTVNGEANEITLDANSVFTLSSGNVLAIQSEVSDSIHLVGQGTWTFNCDFMPEDDCQNLEGAVTFIHESGAVVIIAGSPVITINGVTVEFTVGSGLIEGGLNNEIIIGSNLADEVYGDDKGTIAGQTISGNDSICLEDGDDIASGDANHMSGQSQGGDDFIYGDGGNDRIYGDAIKDISGNSIGGDDHLFGGDGNDLLIGDAGENLAGGGINVAIAGNDELFGEDGNDILIGDSGKNQNGKNDCGDDKLYGGNGNDLLIGDVRENQNGHVISGTDLLVGGAGDDILVGDVQLMNGGGISATTLAKDTFLFNLGDGNDTILDFTVNTFLSFDTLVIAGITDQDNDTDIDLNDLSLFITNNGGVVSDNGTDVKLNLGGTDGSITFAALGNGTIDTFAELTSAGVTMQATS